MRLVAGVVALTLFASYARAEDTRAPEPPRTADVSHGKIPLRVVRVMPESHQALLFDRSRATHVLAEVGGQIDGYTVEAIDDDEVTLSQGGAQIVLAAPARGSRRHDHDTAVVHPRSAAARQSDTTSGPAPVDPYGEPAVRVVEAPGSTAAPGSPGDRAPSVSRAIEAGDGGVRVAVAPGGSAGSTPAAEAPSGVLPSDTSIRVAEAPASASAPSASAPSASPPSAPAPSASAPSASAPSASAPSASAPSASAPSASAPAAAEPATAASPAGDHATVSAAVVRSASAAPPPPAEPRPTAASTIVDASPPAEPPATAAGARRRAAARTAGAHAVAGPDKNTIDARAMADILSTDSGRRRPRMPAGPAPSAASSPGPATVAADPRPAVAAPSTSDIRTASAAPGAIVLGRGEVDSALADFAKLTTAVRGSFSAAGIVLDHVDDGTIFQRAGLRSGDVITAVDGVRLRTLDDAANLYARASTARALTAQILRNGAAMTLHVAIQ
jgi:PDZ domain-containing protein